jgi:hypothetical protein
MEATKINLFIDRSVSQDADMDKWLSHVRQYLIYGLKQKHIEVTESSCFEDFIVSKPSTFIYLPVITKNSFTDNAFTDRIKLIESNEFGPIVTIGLIKDLEILDGFEKFFPDVRISKMFLIDSDTGVVIKGKEFWNKDNFNIFLFKIFDLCNDVIALTQSTEVKLTGDVKKAVYLAEPSPDLVGVRDQVRRELLNQGYEVLPKTPHKGSPKEVEKSILENLQKSSLSVHIFGKFYQEPKEGEMSRAEMENKIAANFYSAKKDHKKNLLNFKRIIWMPDNLTVTNENQIKLLDGILRDKKLYAGSEIIRSSVEELKDIIIEKLHEESPKNDGGTSGSGGGNNINQKNIYIVISDKNKDKGESVKEMLESQGCNVIMPIGLDGKEKDKFRKFDSVLFYYVNEHPSWLRSKVCESYKYNRWQYSSTYVNKAVITTNDLELPNDDLFKDIHHVKVSNMLEHESLMPFFHKAL